MMKMRGFSKKMNGMLMAACIGLGGLSLSISSLPINAIAAETGTYSIETADAKLSYTGSRMLDPSVPSDAAKGKDYVLVLFAYENYTVEAKQPQDNFVSKVYQNGVELSGLSGWINSDNEDCTMVNNFFKTTIKGGVLEYGKAYELTGDGPLTIILQENGSQTVDPVSFEVNIGDVVSSGDDQSQPETEAAPSAEAAETEAKEEAPQQPAMTAEELEAELSRQPVRFLDAEVCNTNDGRLDTSWNSGWIFSHIINESEEEVQHIKVYFVAWDANNLPVILKSKYLNYTAGYTPDLIFQGANLVPGAKLNEDDADTFQVFPYDLTCNVAKAKGIVAAYTTFSGDTWQNPLLGQWLEIYGGGKKLVEPVVYTDEETVTRVQEALNAAGYDCGTPDGKAGPKTFAAMNEYQRQNGLVITNDITDRLLQSLGLAEESDAAPEEEITADTADPDSAEDIKALLQGSWKKENSDKNTMMIFSGDICKMSGAGQEMDFEYTIDTENHDIVLIIKTSDAGDMGARFAYSLDGGVFKFTDKTGSFSKIE